MDRYEFNLKTQQMRKLAADGRYDEAALIADEIDWSRVKNTRLLMLTADIYEATKQPEKEFDILDIAYERSPMGKQLAYRLALVASELKEYDEAELYYKDYVDMAPNDSRRYLLRYRLSRARGEDLDLLIGLLERYLDGDIEERWSYELCELYAKAGYQDKCIELCDELITWFGDGKYVLAALKLKKKFTPLSVSQQQKYDALRREAREKQTDDDTVGVEITRTRNEVLRNRSLPEKMQAVAEKRIQDDAATAEKNEQQVKAADETAKGRRAGTKPSGKARFGAKAKEERENVGSGAAKNAGSGMAVKNAEPEEKGTSAGATTATTGRIDGETRRYDGRAVRRAEARLQKAQENDDIFDLLDEKEIHETDQAGKSGEEVPGTDRAGEDTGEIRATDRKRKSSHGNREDGLEREAGRKNREDGLEREAGRKNQKDGLEREAGEGNREAGSGRGSVQEIPEAGRKSEAGEASPDAARVKDSEEEIPESASDFDVDEIHIKTYSDRAYDTMNIQAELAKSMEAILRTDEARGAQKAARRSGSRGNGPAVRTYIPPATEVAEDDPFGYEQERREPEKQITGQMSIEEILKDLQTRGILKEDTVESALRVTGQLPLWKVQANAENADGQTPEEAASTEEQNQDDRTDDASSAASAGVSEESVVKEMEEISLRDFTTGEIDLEIVQNEVDERQKEREAETVQTVTDELKQQGEGATADAAGIPDFSNLFGEDPESEEASEKPEDSDEEAITEVEEESDQPEETVETEPEAEEESDRSEGISEFEPKVEEASENPEDSDEEAIMEAEEKADQPEEISGSEPKTEEESEQSEETVETEPETEEESDQPEGISEFEPKTEEETEQPEDSDEEAITEVEEESDQPEGISEFEPKVEEASEDPEDTDEEAIMEAEEDPADENEESDWETEEEEWDESEADLSDPAEEEDEMDEAEERNHDEEDFLSGLEQDLSRLGQEGNPYTQMRNEDVKRETEKMDDVFAMIKEMETDLSEEDRIYNAYTEEEPKEKMYLDEVDRKEFEQYLKITGMESQIAKAINDYVTAYNNDGTSKNSNILITGGAKTGKSQLAVSLIRAINRHLGRNGRKTARISGFNLNRKTLSASMPRLVGNDLLIEHAGEINRKIVAELMDILPKYTGGMIVVMEDEKARLDHLFEDYPLLADYFPNHLDIKEYDINEWAAVAKSYARSQGYTIDELGTLALYAEIDALYGMLQGLEVDDIKDIVDDAIEHSERKMGSAFARIFGKKKEAGRKVLHETDFDT